MQIYGKSSVLRNNFEKSNIFVIQIEQSYGLFKDY